MAVWGIVALIAGGIAVMSANISALMPQSVLAGLHKSRLDGPTLELLRAQVAELRQQAVELRRDNGVLAARFALQEQAGSDVTRRVGALEVSLPKLLERIPDPAAIDRGSVTASVGDDDTIVFDADGGSVAVRHEPLPGAFAPTPPAQQPLPPELDTAAATSEATPFGVAIGPRVSEAEAAATWTDLSAKLGPLLLGLGPVLSGDGPARRIVVGPISELADATALCRRLEQVSISCMPMPYDGTTIDR